MKKDVEATISYWKGPHEDSLPDVTHDGEILLGHWEEDNHKMLIRDIRGEESDYSLDTHGFTVRTLPKKGRDVTTQEINGGDYYEEISNMIKEITGAKNVILFAALLRQLKRGALQAHEFKGQRIQAPSPRAHVDWAPTNADVTIGIMVPGATELIQNSTRWQLLGIWTPTKPVERDPLVLTDTRSVSDSEFLDVSRDNTVPERKWTISTVKHGEEHRWHYLSDMTPDEVFIFKHLDSKRGIPAWRCAHTSIEVPGTDDLPPRESLEVRALVGF